MPATCVCSSQDCQQSESIEERVIVQTIGPSRVETFAIAAVVGWFPWLLSWCCSIVTRRRDPPSPTHGRRRGGGVLEVPSRD